MSYGGVLLLFAEEVFVRRKALIVTSFHLSVLLLGRGPMRYSLFNNFLDAAEVFMRQITLKRIERLEISRILGFFSVSNGAPDRGSRGRLRVFSSVP